jgi:sec-independent protein translocase protein TatA
MQNLRRAPIEWRSLAKEAEMLAMDVEWGLPIILLLVLVLFGGSQLPKLARGLGSAQKEFKKGLEEGHSDEDDPKKSEKSKSD